MRIRVAVWTGLLVLACVIPSSAGNKLQHGHLDADDGGTLIAAAIPTKEAVISDQKTAGTDGGTFTSGAWRTRDLNTEIYDPDGIVSISSNQFTLASGTYRIHWTAPAKQVDSHKTRLQNVTDGTTTGFGSSEFSKSGSPEHAQTSSVGIARVTIAVSKAFEIQHHSSGTENGDGFGHGAGFSQVDTYTIVQIIKE